MRMIASDMSGLRSSGSISDTGLMTAVSGSTRRERHAGAPSPFSRRLPSVLARFNSRLRDPRPLECGVQGDTREEEPASGFGKFARLIPDRNARGLRIERRAEQWVSL
jgi:hypothetical protein